MSTPHHTYHYTDVRADEIRTTELREALVNAPDAHAYLVSIGAPGKVEAVLFSDGRVGIAWGGDTEWAQYDDIEKAIDDWLNDGDTFRARSRR